MDRDAFLSRVRQAQATSEIPPPLESASEPVAIPDGDLVDRFVERLEAVSGVAHRVSSDEEAITTVIGLLNDYGANRLLAWHADELPVPDLLGRLIAHGVRLLDPLVPSDVDGRRDHQGRYGNLEVGLTGADGGIAESGTLVLSTGSGRPRMASLIPTVHIALVDASTIAATLADWVESHPNAARRTSNLVFVTGPSRTADIEQIINLGVHGPRHLHVVVLSH